MADNMSRSDYIRNLLAQRQASETNGMNNIGTDLQEQAALTTSLGQSGVSGVDASSLSNSVKNVDSKNEDEESWLEKAWNNVSGFVNKLGQDVVTGMFKGVEGIADLGATALGAMGVDGASDWAKKDYSTGLAQWLTTYGQASQNIFSGNIFKGDYWSKFGSNFMNVFTDPENARSQIQNDYSAGFYGNFGYDYKSDVGNFIGGIAQSFGEMLPSIAVGNAIKGIGATTDALGNVIKYSDKSLKVSRALSEGAFGLAAAGNSAEQAINDGATDGQALLVGLLSGAAEVASEHIIPDSKMFGMQEGVTYGSKQFFKTLGKSMLEEGAEEVITGAVEPFINQIYKDDSITSKYGSFENFKNFLFGGGDTSWEESLFGQFASGAVMGGTMGGVTQVANNKRLDSAIGKDGRKVIAMSENIGKTYAEYLKAEEKGDNAKIEKMSQQLAQDGVEWIKAYKDGKFTESQRKELAKLFENPTSYLDDLYKASEKETDTFIDSSMKELTTSDKRLTRDVANRFVEHFGVNAKVSFGSEENDENLIDKSAYVDRENNEIVLNEKYKKNYINALTHEYVNHIIYDKRISNEYREDFYNRILETKWGKTIGNAYLEKYLDVINKQIEKRNAENENKEQLYTMDTFKKSNDAVEEITAKFIQENLKANNSAYMQSKIVSDLFSDKTLKQKFFNLFKKNANYDWLKDQPEVQALFKEFIENTRYAKEYIDYIRENYEVVFNDKNGIVLGTEQNGELSFSIETYLNDNNYSESGRKQLEEYLKKNFNDEEVAPVLEQLDNLVKILTKYSQEKGYKRLDDFLFKGAEISFINGRPIFSTLIANGDYIVNFDLSATCKKKVYYQNVINYLVKKGVFDKGRNLSGQAIGEIHKSLRKYGLEAPCTVCFVESRRIKQFSWAEDTVEIWNNAIRRIYGESFLEYYNTGDTIKELEKANAGETDTMYNRLKDAFDKLAAQNGRNDKGNIKVTFQKGELGYKYKKDGSVELDDNGNPKFREATNQEKIDRYVEQLINSSAELKLFKPSDLLTEDGLKMVKSISEEFYALSLSSYGAGTPKINRGFSAYLNDVLHLTDNNFTSYITGSNIDKLDKETKSIVAKSEKLLTKKLSKSHPEYTKSKINKMVKEVTNSNYERYQNIALRKVLMGIGGARFQSFSDFQIEQVFDVAQIFSDLAARGLPSQVYTKESAFIELFGLTGSKNNMSLISILYKETNNKDFGGLREVTAEKPSTTGIDIDVVFGSDGKPVMENGHPRVYKNEVIIEENGKRYIEEKTKDGVARYVVKTFTTDFADYEQDGAKNDKKNTPIQSFPFKKAMEILGRKDYSKNCGTIAIGFSWLHCMAMMRSNKISMVIPYHASGMIKAFSRDYHFDGVMDFTELQEEKGKGASGLKSWNERLVKDYEKYEKMSPEERALHQDEINKIPKVVAEKYFNECKRKKITPKFEFLADATYDGKTKKWTLNNDNYYKVLTDFTLYDVDGNYCPQGVNTGKLCDDYEKKIVEYLDYASTTDELWKTYEDKIYKEIDKIIEYDFETQDDKANKLALINESNPMDDDYHTGVRDINDIKTFAEAEPISAPDFTTNQIMDLKNSPSDTKITVYSSKKIGNGVFVTPSLQMATDYAGGGKVYKKDVKLSQVAWIDTIEGQYANTENRDLKYGEVTYPDFSDKDLIFDIGELEPQKQKLFVSENEVREKIDSNKTTKLVQSDVVVLDRPKSVVSRVRHNYAPTLTTHGNNYALFDNGRLRKFSPQEFLKLTGFNDEQIARMSKVNKKTALYRQAGNSIVVQVLEAMVDNMNLDKSKPVKLEEHFAGIGAIRQALINRGYTIDSVGVVEYNKNANKSYNALFGTNVESTDIRDYVRNTKKHKIDIGVLGSPCVDNSSANAKGVRGYERGTDLESAIFWDSFDYLMECNPKYIIWENVANVQTMKKLKPTFDEVIRIAESKGYKTSFEVLNARDFTIPQDRNRSFVVFTKGTKYVFPTGDRSKTPSLTEFLGLKEETNGSNKKISFSVNDIDSNIKDKIQAELMSDASNEIGDVNVSKINDGSLKDIKIVEGLLKNRNYTVNKLTREIMALSYDGHYKSNGIGVTNNIFRQDSDTKKNIKTLIQNIVDTEAKHKDISKMILKDNNDLKKNQEKLNKIIQKQNNYIDKLIRVMNDFGGIISPAKAIAKRIQKMDRRISSIDITTMDTKQLNIEIEQHGLDFLNTIFKNGLKDVTLGYSEIKSGKFVALLDKAMEVYNIDYMTNNHLDFLMPYFDEEVYNALKYMKEKMLLESNSKYMSADLLKLINRESSLINKYVKMSHKQFRMDVKPQAKQTAKRMSFRKNSRDKKVITKTINKLIRANAPAYVVLGYMFGIDTSLGKLATYDMAIGQNDRTLFVNDRKDIIAKKLKELKLVNFWEKNEFSKSVKFNGHDLAYNQLLDLYIGLKVGANYEAMNISGIKYYAKDGSLAGYLFTPEVADKDGNYSTERIEQLKEDVENALPDNMKQFGDFLLEFMNGQIKKDYIKWFDDRYGKGNHRNEIGAIGELEYWTLHRDNGIPTHLDKVVKTPLGLFKPSLSRSQSNSPVVLGNAVSSVVTYIEQLGNEIYLKPTYRKIIHILATKYDGKDTVYNLLKEKFTPEEIKYYEKTMEDILGVLQGESGLFEKMMGRFAVSKLALNVGTILKQTGSSLTSSISLKNMGKGLAKLFTMTPEQKSAYKDIFNRIGALKYREVSNVTISSNANSVNGVVGKVEKATMRGITWMDARVIATGVRALMEIAHADGMAYGSEEMYNFVRDNWVYFELSQIGNTALSKNAISRGDYGAIAKVIFGFMQGANRAALGSMITRIDLYNKYKNFDDASAKKEIKSLESKQKTIDETIKEKEDYIDDLLSGKKKEEDKNKKKDYTEEINNTKKEIDDLYNEYEKNNESLEELKVDTINYTRFKIAGGKYIPLNIASGFVLQGLLITLITELVKRMMGKKDLGEKFDETTLENLMFATTLDWLPTINTIKGWAKGYDVQIGSMTIINDGIDIFQNLVSGNWSKSDTMTLINTMTGIMGVPTENILGYVSGIIKTFDVGTAYEMNSFLYGTSISSATKTMKKYIEDGKPNKTKQMASAIMNQYKFKTDESITDELGRLVYNGYNAFPKSAPTSYTDSKGNEVEFTSKQLTLFNNIYSNSNNSVKELMNISAYKTNTDENSAKAIKKIYDAYYSYAKAKTIGTSADTKLANLLLYTNGNVKIGKVSNALVSISSIEATKTKTKKELTLNYINKQTYLTRQEKLLVMYIAGYSLSDSNKSSLKAYLKTKGMSNKNIKLFFNES